jgi:hypothetical protein
LAGPLYPVAPQPTAAARTTAFLSSNRLKRPSAHPGPTGPNNTAEEGFPSSPSKGKKEGRPAQRRRRPSQSQRPP